jgi:hypothetical protein
MKENNCFYCAKIIINHFNPMNCGIIFIPISGLVLSILTCLKSLKIFCLTII